MFKLRHVIYLVIGVPAFILLVWLFAIPEELLKEKIIESISSAGKGNISVSVTGMKKGLFLSVHSDSLEFYVDTVPALTIREFTGSFDPQYLLSGNAVISVTGKIGTGDMTGLLKHPAEAEIHIEKAELNEVPYLTHLGVKSNGYISADISIKGDEAQVKFRIPDLAIQPASSQIPFIESFHKADGVLSLSGDAMRVDSVGLEGDKGYARLKGDIVNRMMGLRLELMPEQDRLSAIEVMLIGRYQVSPGYYVMPVNGPVR